MSDQLPLRVELTIYHGATPIAKTHRMLNDLANTKMPSQFEAAMPDLENEARDQVVEWLRHQKSRLRAIAKQMGVLDDYRSPN